MTARVPCPRAPGTRPGNVLVPPRGHAPLAQAALQPEGSLEEALPEEVDCCFLAPGTVPDAYSRDCFLHRLTQEGTAGGIVTLPGEAGTRP